jgi:hypothetical protein
MKSAPSVIIIGSNAKHAGKTEFICHLIRSVSTICPVYAAKFITYTEGDEKYHGFEKTGITRHFIIEEESSASQANDTSRMIKAGAIKAFKILSVKEDITAAFEDLLSRIPHGSPLICESNSLRLFVTPSLFVMVKELNKPDKPASSEVAPLADRFVVRGLQDFQVFANKISFDGIRWELRD